MLSVGRSIGLGAALAVATASFPVAAAEPTPTSEFVVGAGASDLGAYVLLAWTSPKRVGAYLRVFPLLYDLSNPKPNSDVTEENAGELGLAVRANRWLTVGVGYTRDKRLVTTYGDSNPYSGTPYTLGSETIVDSGIGAVAVFTFPSQSRNVAFALSASLSDVGSGLAVGITLGP